MVLQCILYALCLSLIEAGAIGVDVLVCPQRLIQRICIEENILPRSSKCEQLDQCASHGDELATAGKNGEPDDPIFPRPVHDETVDLKADGAVRAVR